MRIRISVGLISKFPFLDELRTRFYAAATAWAIRSFGDSFDITRVMTIGAEQFFLESKQCVLAMYHGQIMGMSHSVRQRDKITVLISRHRDGEFIARAAEKLTYKVARGSQTHRAIEGAIQLVKAAKRDQSLMMTVDGPRGPVYKAKMGTIRIAEMTGMPILPFVCKPRKAHHFHGWDRMMGAWWGTPMLYLYGDPISVPRGISLAERESYRRLLELSLSKLLAQSEEYWIPQKAGIFKSSISP
jgi:lysophospholipid acyltransferase (LPLAT)-like uncharacterized protein